jgi:hypothetical protein
MQDDADIALQDRLFVHAGPIVRWRPVTDLSRPEPEDEASRLQEALFRTGEAKRWLGSLRGRAVHGSKDRNTENAKATLVEC